MQSVYEIEGEKKGLRKAVLILLRSKFGELSPSVEARVQSMTTEDELDNLFNSALQAPSLATLGLEEASDAERL